MNEYQEAYEEINNLEGIQRPVDERYRYPEYQIVPEYYNNDYPKVRYISREMRPKNNIRTQTEEYYNYYTESSSPYNDNQQNSYRLNKRYNTPNRIINNNNHFDGRTNINYNIREEYSNPSNNRVNIRKKVFKGSQTPQPYTIGNNNNYYDNQNGEYIDNYQYHEIKDIKNKGFKKYESITHIIGYSNLIPLNRMKNIYGNNYKYPDDYFRENRSLSNYNYQIEDPKINPNSGQNYRDDNLQIEDIRRERIRQQRLREEEELKLEKLKRERIRQKQEELREEKLRKEIIRQERLRQGEENYRNESKQNFKVNSGRYKYKTNISEDIDNYRNNNYIKDKDNIRRHEIIHKNIKTKKYNKIPINTNYNKRNNNKININKKINSSYRTKTNKTISNSYRKNININEDDDRTISKKSIDNIRSYDSNPDLRPHNKIISLLKVQQKTASLNYPNQNKKVDTYGDKFDKEKYKREYINVENVDDGKIENHIETGISKDGQYLISVTSAKKIYDENENDREERENRMYERIEEIEERNEKDDNVYEVPEKQVEEIISTKTTKKKNLGDNYKFYESKHLYKPNITSFTTHRKRTERTIYGNEEHESREVKKYKLRPKVNEYISNIPYDEKDEYVNDDDEEDYDQVNFNYSRDGDQQDQEGEYLNEEENYEEEEEAYY